MTLATVPRYAADQASDVGDHAVVVGGSVAGLLAARVLADGFERVTVLERDALPEEPATRRGVPQDSQPHALQEAGRATIEDLLPSYGEELVSAGGLVNDAARDFNFYDEGGFLAEGPRRMPMYAASRPLIEGVLRRCVARRPRVDLRPGHRCTDYLLDDRGTGVRGVMVRDDGGGKRELASDLVVDATGRTSRTPTWLADSGFPAPDVEEVQVDMAYSTLLVERPPEDRRTFWAPPSHPRTRGAGAAPIEGGYWQVILNGVHGDDPPTDVEGFERFLASLPFDDLATLFDQHPLASEEVHHYPFPSNRRYRYWDLGRFPGGLVVLGDAIASYNPVYGQGISVAALEALVLHHALAEGGLVDLPRRFFEAVRPVVDGAWRVSAGSDFQFPETTGPRPRGVGVLQPYLSRLTRKARTDGRLRDALFRVFTMERPPRSLLRPGVAGRVLRPSVPGVRDRLPVPPGSRPH